MNNFYKCYECNINLCNKCEDNHDYNHNITKYSEINYVCGKHNNDIFIKYCNDCKIDICMSCEAEHNLHNLTNFGPIIPKAKILHFKLEKIKDSIDVCNKDFMKIITKLIEAKNSIITFDLYNEITKFFEGIIEIINEVKYNFNSYYNLKKDIISNFHNTQKYYHILINLKEINDNDDLIEDIKKIIEEENIKNKFKNIIQIYKKINNISEEEK